MILRPLLLTGAGLLAIALSPAPAAQAHGPHGPRRLERRVIHITVSAEEFSPREFALRAGRPARLVFTRTEDGGCTGQVQIPDLGVEPTALPLNRPVAIEVTPARPGRYAFACGMNMSAGTVVVRR
jgi:Cu+-exporting ATPase